MNSILAKVSFSKHDINGVALSDSLFHKLGLKPNQRVLLCLGQHSIATSVTRANKGGNHIWLSPTVRKKLFVPFPKQLHIKKERDRLILGPVVGIVTTGIGNSSKPISPRSSMFRQMLSAQKGKGVYYYLFTPQDVNWSKKTVHGYFIQNINGKTTWKRYLVPFPDVIYNRIPSRTSEAQPITKRFKQNMKTYTNSRFFNPGFFNKWTIHEKLVNHPQSEQHIPETYRSPSPETIKRMIKKHDTIYLKPAGGSLGLGIIKVTRHPRHGYLCRYHTSVGNVTKRFPSVERLVRYIFHHKKVSRYLVQQGISLMKVAGRPVDFRVHLHKNRENRWIVNAIAAKAAGQGSVTTHVRTGGTVLSGNEALQKAFGSHAERIHNDIKKASVKLSQAVEESIGEHIGELGFDIGVDQAGRIWMFEVNSKPGRSIFKHHSLREANRQSIRYILDYSYYLSHF